MNRGEPHWVKVADSVAEISFAPNGMAEVMAGDKRICLARHHDQLFAIAHMCPHAGGAMADGYLDAVGNVVCPMHRYKFALKNGRNVSGEGYYLKNWPVKVEEDGVFVGLERNKLFGLF
jgi:nitrite reductase/ring-hydroxylating ferredoxin subunit